MSRKNIILYIMIIFMLLGLGNNIANASGERIPVVIDGEEAMVRKVPIMMDGKLIESDSPSFIYIDRTLVSARLVAESYGAKVDWDKATRTAIINQNDKEVRLTIGSNVAIVNGKNVKLDENSIPKLVNFGGSSAKTMVPIDFLSKSLGYNTKWDEETKIVHLLNEESSEDTIEESKAKNQISRVEIDKKDGKDVLKVVGTENVKRNTFRLSNPDRLVIDFMDSELVGTNYKKYDYDVGNIKSVRMSQFVPDSNYSSDDKIVRVVFDIKPETINPKLDILEKENNVLLVQAEKDTVGPIIKDEPNSDKEAEQNNTKPEHSEKPEENLNDNGGGNKNKGSKLIVIDPGHGGNAPGAVSVSGVREKDLVLDISLKLERALKSKGYNVLMTRKDDSSVGLRERANIANNNNADVFVSIHGNSVGGAPSANGIEVFHTPKAGNPRKGNQQTELAKFVQEELIKATKAQNRGVKVANFVVIRDTVMPSILVETGFMSNPTEDRKLNDPNYQNKLVEGIVKGIDRYFDKY